MSYVGPVCAAIVSIFITYMIVVGEPSATVPPPPPTVERVTPPDSFYRVKPGNEPKPWLKN